MNHLASFLEIAPRELDISREQALSAQSRYLDLGNWLLEHDPGRVEVDIYPQGSFRLGTVVKPVIDGGDFDIDLVFLRHLKHGSVTQAELKAQAGELLTAYCTDRGFDAPIELGRCWRLEFFEDGFHLDVLPAIPDDSVADGIRLGDRDLRAWQFSNPIGYSDWFYDRMDRRLVEEDRALVATAMRRDIADVPEFLVRTPLQRAVQVLKRSRDIYFGDDPVATTSILITTLAGHAYRGQRDVLDAVVDIAHEMHQTIEKRDGFWWVENPAHDSENFADKWNTDPDRAKRFFEWQAALVSVLNGATTATSLDLAIERLGTQFGDVSKIAHTAIIGSAGDSLRDRAAGRMPALREQFAENLWRISDDCSVDVSFDVANTGHGGYTPRRGLGRRRLHRESKLRFTVTATDVPPPYETFWKVRNFGEQAAFLKQLRGEIVRGTSEHIDHTRYRGGHYVDCYIVKDGVRRAWRRTWVPID